jgi:hypothetical protein
MIPEIITRRSDEQLEFILYETANWTVNGAHGVAFHEVASPRLAIEKAAQFATIGREIVALMRRRPPEIVALSGQVRKLMKLPVNSQVSPGPRVAPFIGETAHSLDDPLPTLMHNDAVYPEAMVQHAMPRK